MRTGRMPDSEELGSLLRRAAEAAAPSRPDFGAALAETPRGARTGGSRWTSLEERVREAFSRAGLGLLGVGLLAASVAVVIGLRGPSVDYPGGGDASTTLSLAEDRGIEVEVGLFVKDLLAAPESY